MTSGSVVVVVIYKYIYYYIIMRVCLYVGNYISKLGKEFIMSWFTKKCTHSDEYTALHKRLTQAELRIDDLEAFQDNVRNMARKVQRKHTEQTEDINTSTGGLLRHGRIQK